MMADLWPTFAAGRVLMATSVLQLKPMAAEHFIVSDDIG